MQQTFRSKSTKCGSKQLTQEVVHSLARFIDSDEVLQEIKLVVLEACSNVVLHSYGGSGDGDMEVRLTVEQGSRVEIEVVDWGKPYTGPTDDVFTLHQDNETGRGMYIIAQLVDRYHFRHEHNTNKLIMEKYIEESLWKH
jgi:serine/threonine-protein kinase RsbW